MDTRTPGHQMRRMRFLGVRFPSPQEFNLGITTESAIPRLPRVVAALGSASRATYAPRILALSPAVALIPLSTYATFQLTESRIRRPSRGGLSGSTKP